MPATKRRSSSITLVLVGASTIGACGEQDAGTMRRDVYAARSDCVQDWGSDPAKCEPVTTSSGRSSYTHYYGPYYYSHGGYGSTRSNHPSGTHSAARPGSRAISTAHVSRGGFGGSAASHGSSGRAGGS